MNPSAENPSTRAPSPLSRRDAKAGARRLLVITAAPGRIALDAATDKSAPTPQLRNAMGAAVNAARRVRRNSPIL